MISADSFVDSLFLCFAYFAAFVTLVRFIERVRLYFDFDFVVRVRLQR